MIGYALAIIGLAFLQTFVAGWSLPVGLVLWVAGRQNARQAYWLAFGGGILTDLLTGRIVGMSAVFFLVAAGLVLAIKSRFEVNWRWLLAIFLLCEIVSYRFF
ncbi:hypothetical protein HY440_00600 [Candidatus Microgenomates bacterium]|nr:hypothetical protein [Candidatus Microgenomates bacterium]